MGDYILPTGNKDGMGIAVAPNEMKVGDYNRIVGVAWEAASASEKTLNLVNVAIGINANDLNHKVEELEASIKNIRGYLKGENDLIEKGELAKNLTG